MEYLQKEYFPFKTVIIDDSLQITLGKKIIAKYHLEFSYFFICTATGSYYSLLHGARQFFSNIPFEQGEASPKGAK